MRVNITLEDDVAAAIERLRKADPQSLKAIVNQALREGLKDVAAPRRKRAIFETHVIDAGRCKVGNVDKVSEIAQ